MCGEDSMDIEFFHCEAAHKVVERRMYYQGVFIGCLTYYLKDKHLLKIHEIKREMEIERLKKYVGMDDIEMIIALEQWEKTNPVEHAIHKS